MFWSCSLHTGMGCCMHFEIWDVIIVIFLYWHSLCCTLRETSYPDLILRGSSHDESRAHGSFFFFFWWVAAPRLRARWKDLKNQLPDSITLSEGQWVSKQRTSSSSLSSSSSFKHFDSQRNYTHTQIPGCLQILFSFGFVFVFAVCFSFLTVGLSVQHHLGLYIPLSQSLTALFYSLVSPSPDLWTMPPSPSWGRGLCAAQAPIWRTGDS